MNKNQSSGLSLSTNEKTMQKDLPETFEIMVFDENSSRTTHPASLEELKKSIDRDKVNLVIINDLTQPTLIDEISKLFNMHPMVMEDALSENELPAIEESGEQLLLTLKLMDFKDSGNIRIKHVGLLLGSYYVIVFKDHSNKAFEDIKSRIDNGKSKARHKKADYLFYLLIDCVVDKYYHVIDDIDNRIDKMESMLFERTDSSHINSLYRIKQPMSGIRSVIYPLREALLNLVQGDYPLIEDETLPFLQDVRDHMNHIVHMFESSRDTLSDLLEINNTNISNRLNHTMKILTIMTTFFIPLTLIAGIYGMNFRFMPELNWKLGYPLALGFMLITAGIMYYIMKKNKLL